MAANIEDIWIGDYVLPKKEYLPEVQCRGWKDCNSYGIVAECGVSENTVYVQLRDRVLRVDPTGIKKISIYFLRRVRSDIYMDNMNTLIDAAAMEMAACGCASYYEARSAIERILIVPKNYTDELRTYIKTRDRWIKRLRHR